jgi:hypothetical protein
MNHSSTGSPPGVGNMPVNASILIRVRPSAGRLNGAIGHFRDASWRKPSQTYVDTSIENTGLFGVDTGVLSLLPFHAPTASAYAPPARASSVGGAM